MLQHSYLFFVLEISSHHVCTGSTIKQENLHYHEWSIKLTNKSFCMTVFTLIHLFPVYLIACGDGIKQKRTDRNARKHIHDSL